MIKSVTLLDSILDIANCVDREDNDVYIARKIMEHCLDIKNLSLEDFLALTNISASRFKKFYSNFDCSSYTLFKEQISLWCDIRRQQIINACQWQKQYQLAQVMKRLTAYDDLDDFLNIELIDEICYQIYHSKRIIMYGAMGMLNLTHDFQIDMKIFGKDFIRSSMYEEHLIVPQDGDFVWLFSMLGRMLQMAGTSARLKIFNSSCKKLLITQHKALLENDYCLSLNTVNDYYEGQYVFMYYLDIVKTRYYELYIKEKEL